jgi:nicotinate-nucleotide adenylyltransferase
MKVGILGGTFDPVHPGHISLAEQAMEALQLDKVLFVPTYIPVFKRERSIADANVRIEAIREMIKDYPKFDISMVDIERGVDTYTIDTVQDLKVRYPEAELIFIAGADVLGTLHMWKDIETLLSMVRFAVVSRPGFALELTSHLSKYRDRFTLLELDTPNISSTMLRMSLAKLAKVE